MKEYSLNDSIIIYPTEEGWDMMIDLYQKNNDVNRHEAEKEIDKHKTTDNGYHNQIWSIMGNFGDMFYNGSVYLETTKIYLCNKPK